MIRHFMHSEPGARHVNEDSLLLRPHPSDGQMWLCALSDGQGGQMGGAPAAQTAVQTTLEAAAAYPCGRLLDRHIWRDILNAADAAVCDHEAAGFATLIGLCASETQVCGASSGDSAALLLNCGQEVLLTENQAKNPPIGSGNAWPVTFSAALKAPWKLLVMSDGVWKYASWDAIIQRAETKQGTDLIVSLRQLAAAYGDLPDDFSVALLEFS